MSINNQKVKLNDSRDNKIAPIKEIAGIIQDFLTPELLNETIDKHRQKYYKFRKSEYFDGTLLNEKDFGPASIIVSIDDDTWLTVYIDVTETSAKISFLEVNNPPCSVSLKSLKKKNNT